MPKRSPNEPRPLHIYPHFLAHPEGCALVVAGDTQVLCTASVEEKVPGWMFGKGRGWVSAEYEMLPRATHTRSPRASVRGKVGGRTHEISRLIGRSLRQAIDLTALGERCITIDCDVLQADGGTRCAAITGGYVALALAVATLHARKPFTRGPMLGEVAAISVGELDAGLQLDLDYGMDSQAVVDANVVMTGAGELVEVQACGERRPFSRQTLNGMLDLAFGALAGIVAAQRAAVATPYDHALTQRAPRAASLSVPSPAAR